MLHSWLLRKNPISRIFGFDRGLPIDRYYIEKFLYDQRKYIRGVVLEIAESTYTKKFGSEVKQSLILHATADNVSADIVGNLVTGNGIAENIVDCFIMTQTLQCIYDIHASAKNSIKVLKPGGHLLISVPGISQISRYDYERWGFYWSFTDLSLKKLFEEFVPSENIKVQTYGNVKAAACLLYGLAAHELSRKDLDYQDPDYQVIITALVRKS